MVCHLVNTTITLHEQQPQLGMKNKDNNHDGTSNILIVSPKMRGRSGGVYDTSTALVMNHPNCNSAAGDGPIKRVRFGRDPTTNAVSCEYHAPYPAEKDVAAEHEILVRWYSRMEFLLFRREAKRKAFAATKEVDSNFIPYFKKVFDACATADGLRSIRTADSVYLSNTPFRGLEPVLFKTLFDRSGTIQAVLVQQEALRLENLNGGGVDAEDNLAALSATSRALSQHSRRLARVLGSGDAICARGTVVARVAI